LLILARLRTFPHAARNPVATSKTRSAGLFAPLPQYAHGFVIERHMPGLAILGIPALDGEKPTVELQGTPTQLDNLAAPQPTAAPSPGADD